jgi:hypothetical protein
MQNEKFSVSVLLTTLTIEPTTTTTITIKTVAAISITIIKDSVKSTVTTNMKIAQGSLNKNQLNSSCQPLAIYISTVSVCLCICTTIQHEKACALCLYTSPAPRLLITRHLRHQSRAYYEKNESPPPPLPPAAAKKSKSRFILSWMEVQSPYAMIQLFCDPPSPSLFLFISASVCPCHYNI